MQSMKEKKKTKEHNFIGFQFSSAFFNNQIHLSEFPEIFRASNPNPNYKYGEFQVYYSFYSYVTEEEGLMHVLEKSDGVS